MNSLPTIDPSNFDPQWELMKEVVKQSGMNMRVVNDVIEALLQVNASSGYGSINISVVGGMVQEFKVTTGKRSQVNIIMTDHVDPFSP